MQIIKLFISSILAGCCIGLGSILFLLAKLTTVGFLGACLFPIGLILICFLKLHLFTGKVGLILRPGCNESKLSNFSWLLVILIGNCLGASLIGNIFYCIIQIVNNSALSTICMNVAITKLNKSFNSLFLESIICGIFVYLAVRFYSKASNVVLKIIGIFIPIMLFVYFGFQHCIANVTYYAVASIYTITMIQNLFITILGNSLGALFVDRLID